MTPDAGAQEGELRPADGSGPRELLRYRSARGRWVVAAMILGSSVAGIDSTVVAVALPAIGRNLHAGFQGLQWTVTSYTLTLASLILLAGSLSDRWGRRRVFLAGLGWFTMASVLCAAAPSIGWLIAARAVQGIGGALMTPASLAIIEAAFQPGDRTRAIGTWAGFSGVSSAIAPFLGGWLLEASGWRWIFLINVPVAAAVAWTTRRHVPESRDTSLSGSAAWPGALAGVAALATITYAILVLPGGGVRSPGFAAATVLALLSSATFAVTERRGSHPMLPPAIFQPAQFRAANAVTFVVNGALGGFAFVLIPALEIIAGDSPVVAGSAVPVQLRPDQLDLRGSVRLRRGARRNLYHRAWPAHPARRPALIQTPVPHLACPVAFRHAPPQTRRPNSSQTSNRSRVADTPSPSPPGIDHVQEQA